MHVTPEKPRFELQVTAEGLQAAVPARRSVFGLLFLMVWLGFWCLGEFEVIRQLSAPTEKTPQPFLFVWLAGWTVGGLFALGAILWQLGGRELITANASALIHRVEAFGLGRTRSYDTVNIKALRVTEADPSGFGRQQDFAPPVFGQGTGPISFDYGARTYRLAASLDSAEAKALVRELGRHLPSSALGS